MPDDLDIFNENDDYQRGDFDDDEDDDGELTDEEIEYLAMMHYWMFIDGP